DELDYLYEGKGPRVLPSFAVVPAFQPMFDLLAKTGGNFAMVVHGAQKVVMHRPFAPTGTLFTTARVKGLYDLRRFAIAHVETQTKDEAGAGICDTMWTIIFRGEGAFGGDASKLTAFDGSFKKPVWPGDTLVTEGWHVAPGKIALQVSVKERSEVVIGGAWATTTG